MVINLTLTLGPKMRKFTDKGGPIWRVRGVGDNSWKAGRDNGCTTKENEEGVCVKPSHCILKNTGVEFIILTEGYVLHKWQWFITRPLPHESCKSEEWGKTGLPMSGANTFSGGNYINCLQWLKLQSMQTAWSHSNSLRPAGPARLFKASSSNWKLSSDRRHKISRASRSITGGGEGVAGSVVFRDRSSIADPGKQ